MTRPRRSLFWTVTGTFLLVIVLGTLAQAWLASAVLWPLEDREARSRAELTVARLAAEIAAAPQAPQGTEIDSLLARRLEDLGPGPAMLMFRGADGSLVTAPRRLARRAERALAHSAPGGAPAGGAPAGGPQRRPDEILARRSVAHGGQALGELLVLRPPRPRGGPGFFAPRALLLSLPVALLASAIAALVLVRLLVRRLRALETLAARVAEGDLSVRVGDTSGDEIGRVAERLDRMAERLGEARALLEANERQRRQLFADITHELATPLTSIRGYAETLLNPEVSISGEERTRYVQWVLDEARRLDRLIRDLFELARLEAGAAPLVLEPLDWVALCRNTSERFAPRFREAGLRLAWADSAPEAWVEADGHRMEEVLENLLVNALRYVPAGGTVELSLRAAAGPVAGAGPPAFALTVADDGPGLPAAELALVFERFYRGAGARGAGALREEAGSGLGLAIVREIVERHGGRVRAAAREPHGLAIAVEVPTRA